MASLIEGDGGKSEVQQENETEREIKPREYREES